MIDSDPREIRQAIVLKQGIRAGRLERVDGGVRFSYDSDYLSSGHPAVATTLPLSSEPVHTASGAVPPYFSGLLPEGRRLTALRRAVKTSADDELSMVIAVGQDPVGDVQVVPQGWEETEAHRLVAQPGPMVADGQSFAEVDFAALLENAGIGDPAVLAGVQDKVSGRMLSLPLQFGGRALLLKFEVPQYPLVVENENYFLRLARRTSLPVAGAQVVHDRSGRPGLLVERFDRQVGADGTLHRLAVEDGTQLMGIYPADKYSVTSEDLALAIGRVCAARPVALRAILIQLVMAWLTGNGDLHAKNVSVLARGDEWRVSPIYDIPSTVPYGDTTMALPVVGQRDNLSRKAFVSFADKIGLPQVAAERSIEEVLRATRGMIDEIAAGAAPFGGRAQRDLVRVLRRRRRELQAS